MSHSFIDRSSNYFTQNYDNEETQKKIDPIAQLKEINNTTVREWGLFNNHPAQMFAKEEEDEKVQAKNEDEELQKKATSENEKKQSGSSGTKTNLPDDVKSKMESSFGTDFSGVNIHTNSGQATNIGALAYTQGNDVHFAPGQFNPGTQKGQELIGHELTHVVQQRQGRVKQEKQGKGLSVNKNPLLEKEADEMGAKAAQGKMADVAGKGSGVQKQDQGGGTITDQDVIEKYCDELKDKIQRHIDALQDIAINLLLAKGVGKNNIVNIEDVVSLILTYIPKASFYKDIIMYSYSIIKGIYNSFNAPTADFYTFFNNMRKAQENYIEKLLVNDPGFDLISDLRASNISNKDFYAEIPSLISTLPDYDQIRKVYLSSYIYSSNTAGKDKQANGGYLQVRINRNVNSYNEETYSYVGKPEIVGVDYKEGTHKLLKDLYGAENTALRLPYEVRISINSSSTGGSYNFNEFMPIKAVRASTGGSELASNMDYKVIQGSEDVFWRWARDGSTVPQIKDLS